jgi:hypothetical protein
MDGTSPVCLTASFDRLPNLLCSTDDYDLLATDIQEKTPKEVKSTILFQGVEATRRHVSVTMSLISDYLADMFLLLPEYPRIEQRMHIVNHIKSRFLFASRSFNTAVLSLTP